MISRWVVRDHSFSTYAKFYEKLTFLTGGRNVSSSENCAYVLNEWSLIVVANDY